MTKLSELKTGEHGTIVKILGHGAFRKRVIEMGFVRGHNVKVLLNAPLKDPIKYKILDYEISLRRSEADLIEVVKENEYIQKEKQFPSATIDSNDVDTGDANYEIEREKNTINIALIGNPNCGKTSLFNELCNGHERVGNYSGVTVDAKDGHFDYGGFHFKVVDLPGTYSLSSYSPEERYVRRYLKDETPDVIINVVVASNLERNLYLTTELIDMDRSMVIALNMYDELEASGAKLDYEQLGRMIGVPMIPTVSKSGKGVKELLDTIIQVFENTNKTVRHVHVNLGSEIEEAITVLKNEIKKSSLPISQKFSPRYIAIKLLENDSEVLEELKNAPDLDSWIQLRDKAVEHIETVGNEDIVSAIASEKYGFISGALKETMTPETKSSEQKTTDIIDTIVTHKLFGFPIFLLIMWFIFWVTFELGSYPMDWIDAGVAWLAGWLDSVLPDNIFRAVFVDGIVQGAGGVLVFLPNILILFFFVSIMESTGYMARVAFIMDKLMHTIGLHGKSFIPMIIGFGCNVPAIMATRTIESRKDRLITMLIIPFMSCSARLPVYVLLAGLFFPKHAGTVIFLLYLFGILVSILSALLFRHTILKAFDSPFVMEMPPYRWPTWRSVGRSLWVRGKQYLKKIGGIILIASIIVWALGYFPVGPEAPAGVEVTPEMQAQLDKAHLEQSYLSRIGRFIEPVIRPLGMNWEMGVCLLAGISAKEVVVSTMVMIMDPASSFTSATALSFLVFVLLYFPCIGVFSTVARESGSWRWAVFMAVYTTAVAWIVSFIVFQVGTLLW